MLDDPFYNSRKALVDYIISSGKLKTKKIIEAFLNVPRHLFVTSEHINEAYFDEPLPIIEGTTIPQPSVVAEMMEALQPDEGHKILEIGTGSGWATALLSYCIGEDGIVISLEGNMFVAGFAKKNLEKIGINNVEVIIADGSPGYERRSPYDRIIYGVAMPEMPLSVLNQLKIKGIAVAPIGSLDMQRLTKFVRVKEDKFEKKELSDVVFAPAYGKLGFHFV
ncbi:MAG: protein-L-isoaspartate(D-aspartate) O-methyltransferase [Candidatus Micrarchaeia archaeon]